MSLERENYDRSHPRYVPEGLNVGSVASDDQLHPPMREMTVGEYLNQQIKNLEHRVRKLHNLKDSLPKNYLDMLCSGLPHPGDLGPKL